MGCDVHMWAEVRSPSTWEKVEDGDVRRAGTGEMVEDVEVRRYGTWEKVGDVFPNAHADAEAERRDIEQHNKWLAERLAEHPTEDDEEYRDRALNWKSFHRPLVDHPYDQRDYALFAILADVRNGLDEFTPIAEPRGVPDDASPEYRAEVAVWSGDGHSHSWLTLKELQAYDWHKTTCTGESGEFVEQVIPMLAELGAPDDVRIVFFFDN